GLALRRRVFGERRVDPRVRVGIDEPGEAEKASRIEDLQGVRRGDLTLDAGEPSVLHAEVHRLDGGLAGAHEPHRLCAEVEETCRHVSSISMGKSSSGSSTITR